MGAFGFAYSEKVGQDVKEKDFGSGWSFWSNYVSGRSLFSVKISTAVSLGRRHRVAKALCYIKKSLEGEI